MVWASLGLECYNGWFFFQSKFVLASDFRLFTDTAGSKGFGIIWKTHWCCAIWPEPWVRTGVTRNVVLLELFTILVALELWGPVFANRRILVETNNKVVLYSVNCSLTMNWMRDKVLRQLVFRCLKCNVWLKAKYTPRILNNVADSLSRLQMDCFWSLLPEADVTGIPCPDHLWKVI